MTQILLGQSYFLRFDPKLWGAMQPYPPLGTLYAASYLRQHGYEVALFDAMLAESEDEWGMALDDHKPQYAIIYEDNFNYLSKMCLLRMREAAFKMVDMAKSQGCMVILCGADATDHYAEYLARGADYCLLGEGEETLIELLSQLSAGKDPGQIIGLAARNTLLPSHRPDITHLDKLPFPAWDLVDIEKYRSIWMKRHGYFSMNMVTTRGCPYHCNWCAKPIWGQRYNSRSPKNVVAEMKWIKENFHPDHIWFADDILGLKPGWIQTFAVSLQEADAAIPFKCLQRADLVNEKTAAALAKAGCKTVWIGAESGSQKILDAMEKGDKVEDIYRAAKLLHENGIEVGFFLQFGYPGETWEDVQKTLKMVRECAPNDIGISVSYPLPGTKFFERVKMELGDKQNWIDSDDLAILYRGPYPTEFYRVLHGRVHYEFRAWKALRQPSLRGLISIPRNLAGLMRSEMRLRRYVQGEKQLFNNQTETIAEAFSRTAEKYDAFANDHPHLTRMRKKVYEHVSQHLARGSSILELNAGTGTDAVELAQRGYFVHATDIAPGMLNRLRDKVQDMNLGSRITWEERSFLSLENVPGAPFDAVFSDLGGLNCVPDLSPVIQQLPKVLHAGSLVTWVLMPRICLWEWLEVFRGNFRLAFRRMRQRGVRANLEGLQFDVYYFSPRQVINWFGEDHNLVALEGLSVITPTAESKNLAKQYPRLYRVLSWLDDKSSPHWPWYGWGDFYILTMRYNHNIYS